MWKEKVREIPLYEYEEKQIYLVLGSSIVHKIILDGTNTIMKNTRMLEGIVHNNVALVNKCDNLFKHDVFVLCEVIPIYAAAENKTKKLVTELNSFINSNYD